MPPFEPASAPLVEETRASCPSLLYTFLHLVVGSSYWTKLCSFLQSCAKTNCNLLLYSRLDSITTPYSLGKNPTNLPTAATSSSWIWILGSLLCRVPRLIHCTLTRRATLSTIFDLFHSLKSDTQHQPHCSQLTIPGSLNRAS